MTPASIEIVREMPMSALQVVNREEIDVAIATAKNYPRDLQRAAQDMRMMVCADQETAAMMFYAIPRGGKIIDGPGVRFAECLAHSWGNLNIGARMTEELDQHVVAQGVAHDLQANVRIGFEVRRRILDKEGHRYNADMITVTGNAAAAIALRNAVLRVIPKPLWFQHYLATRATAIGKAVNIQSGDVQAQLAEEELVEQRNTAIAFLEKTWHFELDNILAILHRKTVNEITEDDVATLRGLATALKDGDITVHQAITGAKAIPKIPTRKPAAQKRADQRKPAKYGMPDRKVAEEPKDARKAANGRAGAAVRDATRKPTPAAKTITEVQRIELFRVAAKRVQQENIGLADAEPKMIRAACAHFGFKVSGEITRDKYDQVVAYIQKMEPPKK